MEIEAKFVLPDVETRRRLQVIDHLAGYALLEGQVKHVSDAYLDTAERAILASGYACRRRIQDGSVLVTLKALRGAKGAVHRREELEVLLPSYRPPVEWPAGPLRDRVLDLIGEAPLTPLVDLRQTRIVRLVRDGERLVAEFSLDEVCLVAEGKEQTYFELEVELAPEGTEDDLGAVVNGLGDGWGLVPQTRSKFERALAFLEEVHPAGSLLTMRERAVCLQTARRDDLHGRRARAVLALDGGATQAEAGRRANMSSRRVRYWLAAFREKRLGVFPARVMRETRLLITPVTPVETELIEKRASRLKVAEPVAEPGRPQLAKKAGLVADDSMAEAARKIFLFHLQRMLYHEPGTRAGEDIEELHDMRVATRRMRAALKVFCDYLDMDQMRPFAKGLKNSGRALGAVRDLDVFWERTSHYLDTLPPARQGDLEPLRAVWKAQREKARDRMLAYLDSGRYSRFKERFAEFLQRAGAGSLPVLSGDVQPRPHRLRHIVPVVVYERLAVVRAYEECIAGPDVPLGRFHQLRIDAKGLRYTLEFFREVLGKEAKPLIESIKSLQDHLGSLQDAVVASNLLRDFLTWGTWGHAQDEEASLPRELVVAPGVASYLAARQIDLQHLLDTFPQAWARIHSREFGRQIAEALATL